MSNGKQSSELARLGVMRTGSGKLAVSVVAPSGLAGRKAEKERAQYNSKGSGATSARVVVRRAAGGVVQTVAPLVFTEPKSAILAREVERLRAESEALEIRAVVRPQHDSHVVAWQERKGLVMAMRVEEQIRVAETREATLDKAWNARRFKVR